MGRPESVLSLGGRAPPPEPERNPSITQRYNLLAAYLRARFGDDERGASLVEYALPVALIAVVCIIAVSFLGKSASSKSSDVGSSIGA